MIRIHCKEVELNAAMEAHLAAIKGFIRTRDADYQEKLFADITSLDTLPKSEFGSYAAASKANDWKWLRNLILADVSTLRSLTRREADRLQFKQFEEMYEKYFSHAPQTYLDEKSQYNAYKLIQKLGLHVCPYCDEEPIETLQIGGKQRRNAQLDHFFPKGRFSALAMCFFNLIPSGSCNQLKLKEDLAISPYEPDIEACTKLYPDIEIGANLERITPDDCHIDLHATGGMVRNAEVLGLEARYQKYAPQACRLLKKLQMYNQAKQEELKRDFFEETNLLKQMLDLDVPGEEAWGQEPLTKLKHDILAAAGYLP